MDEKVIARFWKYVDKRGPDDCWMWTASRLPRGYGCFGTGGYGNRDYAHRVSWAIANGPIPKGAHILHSCDNPPCCNPRHLRAGTRSDNARDMYSRKRYPVRRGESASRAKLTAAKVVRIRALRERGYTLTALAEKYGVSMQSIHDVVHRRSWRHVSE